ncbi:MAG: sugar phosphate isomerase/epimerase [Hoeflea sp.]|uniref:sugar phosphate isomerase/epimerase family protein n=1 Tax=Hoeflea sp. TaxID=1940281 RepID=UPI003298D72F
MNIVPVELAHLTALDCAPVAFCALAAATGYQSVSLRMAPVAPGAIHYPLSSKSAALNETRAAITDTGIRISSVEIVSLSPDLDICAVEPLLAAGAELGATGLCVTGDDGQTSRISETFARLCELAHGYGINVDLEFMRWRPVATLQDALAVVSAAGAPNGFVLIDVLHLIRSGGSAADIARANPAQLRCVQLCDAHAENPAGLDVIGEARGGRLPIGDGQLPLAEIIATLPERVSWAAELPTSAATGRAAPREAQLSRSRQTIADLFTADQR